ncbi:GntR family transcriptional regulator [Leucobacter sp. wl10]|uniref:GntR family transcriptional regulator n=1 Tax=Leucobacter sp. wl10 TaxID=2304677 RepID=UPI000E5A70F5|nr:GntR family transcriptional regulator [Leucobacter sp. wl10]RGE24331.1 GntR family transcriptional regulator [Leucobacter sp. wl10]
MSLREQALSELRARLISGALKPGSVYSAASIANDLGVSNGPVREAMLSLVNQGLMEVVRNKGFRVIELTPGDRENIAEIRALLEIPSMAKLTGSQRVRDSAGRFAALASDIVDAAHKNDIVGYLEADREFHLGLLDLLDNARLTRFIGTLRDQTRQYGLYALAAEGELVSSAEEHQGILDALLGDDPELVASLMKTHLRHLWTGWSSPELEPVDDPTSPISAADDRGNAL